MNNSPTQHQTSAFMNANGGSYPDVNQGGPGDAASGGRLLSTSGQDKPRVRMTKPAKLRVRLILIVLIIITIAIAIILIAALTATGSKPPSFESSDQSKPRPVPHEHVRCNNDVIVAGEGEHSLWRNYDAKARMWKTIPNVQNAGFVLISPKYQLEEGYPGVQVSILLPSNNTRFHVMAVTPSYNHSHAVALTPGKYGCESVAIDDPKFFDGNGTVFRIYVFYKRHMPLEDIKFTVTSLPLAVRFKPLKVRAKQTISPKFVHIGAGVRDVCSLEIENSERICNWWNIEDGDNADFHAVESHDCISSGARTSADATWFLSVDSHEVHHESRALLISPVIQRKTPSIILTMWFIFKCKGPHLRLHLIPTGKNALRRSVAASSAVAELTEAASHNDWKFVTYQIQLPPEHDAYHLVLEAIVVSNGNCTYYQCSTDGSSFAGKPATSPMLGLDSITIEHMHEQCENTTGSSVMDCKFQTDTGDPTTCEWVSSGPSVPPGLEGIPEFAGMFQDWKTVNSGDGSDHGATSQHLEGRGYIMSFDASGRATSESYIRTPLLVANNNCSCVMEFQYLMRGYLTPRMQVNMIFGMDIQDDKRESVPQWSLLGHQSDNWQIATIALNLKKDLPFQIELRVLDIYFARGDVHFDDMHFLGCDMEKYTTT